MNDVRIQIIVGNRVINFLLEDIEEMEIKEFPRAQRTTEVTIKCRKVTNMPRIRRDR